MLRGKLLHRLLFTVYGLLYTVHSTQYTSTKYTVHRTPYTFAAVFCLLLSISNTSEAAANYDRTMEELSQAVTLHKSLKKEQTGKYDATFRRDPMRPLVDGQGNILTTIGLKDGLSVQGIIWSEARPLAVIDGELFGKGDTIDQYTIEEVHRDRITVKSGETVQEIPIERGLPAIGGSASGGDTSASISP